MIFIKINMTSKNISVEDVPEEERKRIATEVSDKILAGLEDGTSCDS